MERDSAPRTTLPKAERIAKRADYTRIYAGGRKQFGRHVVVFAMPNEGGICRIGITATRKIGKANVRNRLKRWSREVYRLRRRELGLERRAIDFVINIKHSAVDTTYADFSDDLARSLRKAASSFGE
jgi:ribonuclease P protein component